MNLDIGKAFTFITDDPNGVSKVLIGGALAIATVIALITIIGWIPLALILFGYCIQLCRNVIAGAEHPLPEWTNWGERLVDGFKGWAVGFVYALPASILTFIFNGPRYITQIRDAVTGETTTGGTAVAVSGLSGLGGCLAWLLGFGLSMLAANAVGRYAATNSLGEAFQVGAVFAAVRQNIGTYLVLALFTQIVLGIVAVLGLIAFCIGVFFTAFYSQLVHYHLVGQAYRSSTGAMVQPAYNSPYGGQRPF